ncbi:MULTISPECIES: NAD-binding protein [Cysteiniphilum]|uniref:NAD-binding protein n=1 Tax=Cysteiniphilum TaxID=2056696 RepID=UPI00178545D6|nr:MULTISPECIES: NAD-binding protein [Cysteiniphilum]
MPRLVHPLKEKLMRFSIPLFLAILLFLNGVFAILIGVFPFIEAAIHDEGVQFVNHIIAGQGFKEFNTVISCFIGYLMLLIGRGIYRRLRFFWILALLMLITLFLTNIFVYNRSGFLTWFYFVEIIGLAISWKVFNVRSKTIKLSYAQFIVILSFILAFLYGVIGAYLLRDQFNSIKDWPDAIYFTVVTYSTVGYGDITPITDEARLFVVSMIFIGLGAFAAVLTFIVSAFIDRLQNLFQTFNKGKKHMKDHVIICGLNDLTHIIINELQQQNKSFLIIDSEHSETADSAELKSLTLHGNANDPDILDKASITDAHAVIIAYEKDADNIITLLSINEFLNNHKPSKAAKITIRINQKNNINKAKSLGAAEVISPLVMAANAMLDSSLSMY